MGWCKASVKLLGFEPGKALLLLASWLLGHGRVLESKGGWKLQSEQVDTNKPGAWTLAGLGLSWFMS